MGRTLDAAGVEHWLFGGWAVDFYAGEVTRPHDDLDLAVWLADVPAIAALLEAGGWRHAPLEDEDGGTGYEREGVRQELTFVVRDEHGRPAIPLRSGTVAWPGGALGADTAEIGGVSARLVSREALTAGKESPRDDPDDAAKDLADFAVLSRLPGRRSIRRA